MYFDAIPDFLPEWAMQQQVFFIASVPLSGQHINLSPKGLSASTLRVSDPNRVAWAPPLRHRDDRACVRERLGDGHVLLV